VVKKTSEPVLFYSTVYSPTGLQINIAECYRIVGNACCKRPWSASRQYPTICVRAVRSIKKFRTEYRTWDSLNTKNCQFFSVKTVQSFSKSVPRTIKCKSQLGFIGGISFQLSRLIQFYSLR